MKKAEESPQILGRGCKSRGFAFYANQLKILVGRDQRSKFVHTQPREKILKDWTDLGTGEW